MSPRDKALRETVAQPRAASGIFDLVAKIICYKETSDRIQPRICRKMVASSMVTVKGI